MAQQLNQTIRNTFNKGLLTEFSELKFPEEASVDELNCVLHKSGARSRRLGIEFELGYVKSTETYSDDILSGVQGVWHTVGGEPDVQFAVVQMGRYLRFYQKTDQALSSTAVPISKVNANAYILDLTDFEVSGSLGANNSHVDVTSLNGLLVVASPSINTFYIERDPTTHAFTTTVIDFKVRDFEYLSERVGLTAAPDVDPPDINRQYDTQNCGWVGEKGSAALTAYVAANSFYPPLTHPWYSGKDGSGLFNQDVWKRVYSGNTLIVNGHFLLDLFHKDRSAASGIPGFVVEASSSRFSSVTSFAGRIFYGGVGSRIYFSKILEDNRDIGTLYQVNDPTSEEISDLLDSDGGYINIPDASKIKKLHVFGSSLLVFADNGVWRISGVDEVFRSTEYSVYKITEDGLAQKKSFIAGQNGVPFWWSYSGMHTIQVTDQGGMVEVNLSRDTIQTRWNSISGSKKALVQSAYDEEKDILVWMYPSEGEATSYKLNEFLFLDASIGAFYPWRVEDIEEGGPIILGASFFNGSTSNEVTFNVIDNAGNQVVDASGNEVVATFTVGATASSSLRFLTKASDGTLVFSTFTSISFTDWDATSYTSYAESAYNFIGDLGRRKNSPYITVFCKLTETGWELQEDGSYLPVRPSSLKVSSYWDFSLTPSSTSQQAYRFKYPLVVDTSDLTTIGYPNSILSTRLKTRGRGRVFKVRFESEEGRDFYLLGWETLDARNRSY